MRLRTKIYYGYLIILAVVLSTAFLNWYTSRILQNDLKQARQIAREIDDTNRLGTSIIQLLMPANDYLITADINEKEKYNKLYNNVNQMLQQGSKTSFENTDIHRVLKEELGKINALSEKIFSIKGKPLAEKTGSKIMYEMDAIGNHTYDIIFKHNKEHQQKLEQLYQKSQNDMLYINVAIISGLIFLVLSGFIMIYFFNKHLGYPIERLSTGFRGVSHGRWNQISLNQNDELSELAQEFNAMIDRMSSTYEDLENEVRSRNEELSLLNKRLETLAITDGLTSLYNYRYFSTRLHQEFNRALRYKRPLSIIMIDIDHFKLYNDRNGHLAGDQVIRKVSQILLDESRKSDIVSRYGGEEFVILSPELNENQVLSFGERLRAHVANYKFPNKKYQPGGALTISIGIVVNPETSNSAENFLKKSDQALYQAKKEGRNRIVFYKEKKQKSRPSKSTRTKDTIPKQIKHKVT